MNEIIKPDYQQSILSTVASILKHYGVPSTYATSPVLDEALQKDYRNVVLMVFDGMGTDMLRKDLPPDNILVRNIQQELTSVYPCTTTAAMTSYYSGLSPQEHGWLGWSLYFKEFNACVDAFANEDSFTKNPVGDKHAAFSLMPYKTIYEKIDEASKSSIKTYTVVPSGISSPSGPHQIIPVESIEQLCQSIQDIGLQKEKKFIMSYWFEPDATMHKVGCYTEITKHLIASISKEIEYMCAQLKDTLVILSADHGLVNATEVYLNEITELDECLLMPPSIESRATSLFIKPDKMRVFKERFNHYFKNDFILIPREEFIQSGILGKGVMHPKASDFIGDYMACAIGDKMLRYKTMNARERTPNNGQHAGLRKEEMMVPLIIIEPS